MKTGEFQHIIDSYVEWLRDGLSVERLEKGCELTIPFLDRHNDHLQVYVTRRNGSFLLTDDGYTISDLASSGLDFNTPKRRDLFTSTLNGFGVRTEGQQLFVEASHKTLGQKIHSLVQAMLAVDDMFVLAQPRIASFFWEDVKEFLDEHKIRYITRVKLSGRSGYDHGIDFLIPKSTEYPDRLVHAINVPTRSTVGSYLFSITDIRASREDSFEAYAFLNDSASKVSGEVSEALDSYSINPVLWTGRGQHVEALAG